MSPAPWLIATDLDGTLFDHTLFIDPRVRAAIRAAQSAGHIVTLATGRMVSATRPIAAELGIEAPLICYQGALVQQGDTVWLHQPLPLPLARTVVQFAQANDLHINVYVGDRLYVAERNDYVAIYTSINRSAEVVEVGDLLAFLDAEPTKLLFIRPETEAAPFLTWALGEWGDVAQVVRSHANFVELTHPAASKGAALLAIAHRLGIPRERILAVGDNDNDRSMITAAGAGVAMGNAPTAVQAVADWVAPSVSDAGLAAAIERFVLKVSHSHEYTDLT